MNGNQSLNGLGCLVYGWTTKSASVKPNQYRARIFVQVWRHLRTRYVQGRNRLLSL